MRLARLDAHGVRNLAPVRLDLPPGLILITGANGSGKTSLLEAVWLLATGRSFRSTSMSPVIKSGDQSLTVYGEVQRRDGTRVRLGISRERRGPLMIKVAGERVRAASALAEHLPVQLINPDSVALVTGPPDRRRRFIDWGLFHVEPRFHACWLRFRRGLAQRNALLRRRAGSASAGELEPWERELSGAAAELDQFRRAYVEQLRARFVPVLEDLGGPAPVTVEYVPGWDDARTLSSVLAEHRERDRELGYTRDGPQRAELKLVVWNGRRAAEVLSRGQQKLVASALLLAQGRVLGEVTDKTAIHLVDDLPAELDRPHRERLGRVLQQVGGQVLVTAVERELVLEGRRFGEPRAWFHVEHGRITSARDDGLE